ncbi:MAG: DUF11 domain-containing protein, partial [Chloroflexota bacterium]|nr:DUF11 domain-containing protein [Chloroflexota bacterium]
MSALLVSLVVTQGVIPAVFQARTLAEGTAASLSAAKNVDLQLGEASAEQGAADSAVSSLSSTGRTAPPLALQAAPNAPSAVNILATMVDSLPVDVDNDDKADPGDTIRYTVAITNTGNTDATGAVFSDTIDSNTTMSGNINVAPIAVNDSYTGAVGNTRFVVNVAPPAGEPAVQQSGAALSLFNNDQEFLSDSASLS